MDRAFFEQLAMPLFDQLYNHACWLTGDPADAEDLVQETYAKALKGFGAFAKALTCAPGCFGSCAMHFSLHAAAWLPEIRSTWKTKT